MTTDLMAATTLNSLPGLLLSLLERRYLDAPADRWELRADGRPEAQPLLQEVLSLGRPRPADPDTSPMPQLLTASHALGNAVVLAVHGTGQAHRLLLGSRRIPGRSGDSAEDVLQAQARLLRAQVSGLRLGPERRTGDDELAAFLRSAPAVGVVTGIPSLRDARGSLPPGLDRLMNAVGPRRYALVVVAEPLAAADLDTAIAVCRQLRSSVAGLKRMTVQVSNGRTDTTAQAETRPTAPADPLPMAVAGVLAFALAGPGYAPGAMSLVGTLTGTAGGAVSTQTATSESTGRAISHEVLDADAEACDLLLQQHLDRLQLARSRGWWQASVYVAAESESVLSWVTAALRGLCSGDASGLDPIRLLRPEPWQVRDAAITGRPITLHAAGTEARHPFGAAYDALATCVTSDELAVLTGLPRRDVPGLTMVDVGDFALTLPPSPWASCATPAATTSRR
jgi:hypothetical protein